MAGMHAARSAVTQKNNQSYIIDITLFSTPIEINYERRI
jgi:hypothetical protein